MIKENKASKYLLYAVGEIILVVIGILIALQINNNNEDKKARKQEIKYLKNLQIDIQSELKNNDTIIAFRANKSKVGARMLEFTKLETVQDIFELEGAIQTVFWWTTFIPTNNTYKELLSSGNLNLSSGLTSLNISATNISSGTLNISGNINITNGNIVITSGNISVLTSNFDLREDFKNFSDFDCIITNPNFTIDEVLEKIGRGND